MQNFDVKGMLLGGTSLYFLGTCCAIQGSYKTDWVFCKPFSEPRFMPNHNLTEAQDPTTPPERLRHLSLSGNPTVVEAVTANANTPMDVLVRQGAKYPDALILNPIFPLLLFENPRFFAGLSDEAGVRLVRHPMAWPELWMLATQGRPRVRLALTQLPNMTQDVLQKLETDKNALIRTSAQLHVHQPIAQFSPESATDFANSQVQAFLKSLTPSTWTGNLFRFFLQYAPIRADLQSIWAVHGQEYIRLSLAVNPYLSNSLRTSLLHDKSESVRLQASTSDRPPATDSPVRLHLESPDFDALQRPDLLTSWARGTDVALRVQAAIHPNTPPDALRDLAKSTQPEIRKALILNPATPDDALEDALADLRFIENGLKSGDPAYLNLLLWVLGRSREAYFSIVALFHAGYTPTERFRKKLASDYWLERYVMLQHPDTPPAWATDCADDPNQLVRNLARAKIKSAFGI